MESVRGGYDGGGYDGELDGGALGWRHLSVLPVMGQTRVR